MDQRSRPGLGIHVSPLEADNYLMQLPSTLEPLNIKQSNVDLEPDWQGSEIDTVLGNEKSRLKTDAKLLPHTSGEQKGMALEKAKRRSRVDVDIFLASNVCVEGGCLEGLVKVLIRKGSKKSQAILLSGGKVRVIGFESISKDEERSVFYQCSADLSDVSSDLGAIYCSGPDDQGFMRAREGIHVLPFTLKLIASEELGKPKGYMTTHSGLAIRYIAMISFRVKDPTSGKVSISHFYRDCCVWPRLNPSLVLSRAQSPIQMTVSDGLALGGNGKVTVTASLHRLYWVAGQLCHVIFEVTNNSRKLLKALTLELFQTISTFKIKKSKSEENDHDIHHPTKITKQIAQSTLTIAQAGTRGHASANGWWVGVAPGKSSQMFSHSIHLPGGCLSIPRGKLIEVSYKIRATISPGTFLSSDIQLSIPIEIINYLSLDPPPPPLEKISKHLKSSHLVENSENNTIDEYLDQGDDDSMDENSADDLEELGNLSVHDDNDEVVQHVVTSARIDEENAPRFADLYYSSIQGISEIPDTREAPRSNRNSDRGPSIPDPVIPKKAATHFADRVEEKIAKRKNAMAEAGVTLGNVSKPSVQLGNEAPNSVNFALRTTSVVVLDSKADTTNPDNSTPTEKGILNTQLKDRGVSVNDIIDTYIQPSRSKDCKRTPPPRKAMFASRSNPVTPNRHPSIGMLRASASRPKSVRDRIRELEDLEAGLT